MQLTGMQLCGTFLKLDLKLVVFSVFFHSGRAWAERPQAARMKKKLAVESAAKFLMKKTWQLNQLPNFHIFYYETYFLLRNPKYSETPLAREDYELRWYVMHPLKVFLGRPVSQMN